MCAFMRDNSKYSRIAKIGLRIGGSSRLNCHFRAPNPRDVQQNSSESKGMQRLMIFVCFRVKMCAKIKKKQGLQRLLVLGSISRDSIRPYFEVGGSLYKSKTLK
jgi:hypothetical protein